MAVHFPLALQCVLVYTWIKMNAATETDPRIEAILARAQARAAELGRWDAPHAVLDLIAAELPREVYNAWGWYCANDTFATLCAAWAASGGRGEFSSWAHDVVAGLGTWLAWAEGGECKCGLRVPFSPPSKPLSLTEARAKRRAERPGLWCGRAGHGDMTVFMDPRGPDYRCGDDAIEICTDCFADIVDQLDTAEGF